jgi:hypothetical protein
MAPMPDLVPKLAARPLSRTMRLLSVVHPGIRAVTSQIGPYTAWWDEQNQAAAGSDGPPPGRTAVTSGSSTNACAAMTTPDGGWSTWPCREPGWETPSSASCRPWPN